MQVSSWEPLHEKTARVDVVWQAQHEVCWRGSPSRASQINALKRYLWYVAQMGEPPVGGKAPASTWKALLERCCARDALDSRRSEGR